MIVGRESFASPDALASEDAIIVFAFGSAGFETIVGSDTCPGTGDAVIEIASTSNGSSACSSSAMVW